MHGNVINVPTNVDQIQSILPHLSHDDATIGFFKVMPRIQITLYLKKCSLKQ